MPVVNTVFFFCTRYKFEISRGGTAAHMHLSACGVHQARLSTAELDETFGVVVAANVLCKGHGYCIQAISGASLYQDFCAY